MHIEKNMFENIFNIVMDVKGKTKDNIKAKMDIALFCHHTNMELVSIGSWVVKLKTSLALDKSTITCLPIA
jgi:tRNA A37 threonylcarbamoyladenosine dehydratase